MTTTAIRRLVTRVAVPVCTLALAGAASFVSVSSAAVSASTTSVATGAPQDSHLYSN